MRRNAIRRGRCACRAGWPGCYVAIERGPRGVLVTGCSGGGKSTLLAELAGRGHRIVEEPGRRVVAAELASGGRALPWTDSAAFARRALSLAVADHRSVRHLAGPTLFDRGVIDAAVALKHATGGGRLDPATRHHRYHRTVFVAPPWPDLYAADAQRRHGLDEAVAEYRRLSAVLPSLGYSIVILPRIPVRERADLIADALDRTPC